MSVAQPDLPGVGVTVRILRDDGQTYAGVTVAAELYSPGTTNMRLSAATGLSSAEISRALIAPQVAERGPREPAREGLGWAVYVRPGSIQVYILRDDRSHLSWQASPAFYTNGLAAAYLSGTAGLSAAETARIADFYAGPVKTLSQWILASGAWSDTGIWIDTQFWKDAA